MEDIELAKFVFCNEYLLGDVKKIEVNNIGWGTNYDIISETGKYFLKVLKKDCFNNNSQHEIDVCKYLHNKKYPVSNFIKNIRGQYISNFDSFRSCHLQHFINGEKWKKNTAPVWLLEDAIAYISKIHLELKHFLLNKRIAIERINDKDYHLERIDKIIQRIKRQVSVELQEDLLTDLKKRKHCIINQKYINKSKLTYVNGHSDYSVTQIITRGKKIMGIIDMTEVSNIPAIWEIMRFYINSSISFKKGIVDIPELMKLIKIYKTTTKLQRYDLEQIYDLNYNYMNQAISVYEKYLETKDNKFLHRLKNRIGQIRTFEKWESYLKHLE